LIALRAITEPPLFVNVRPDGPPLINVALIVGHSNSVAVTVPPHVRANGTVRVPFASA
jgi:hypothetical protein